MEKELHLENILNQTITQLKTMVDIDCVVGSPIVSEGGDTVIPISKMTVGFVSGGGEYGYAKKKKKPFNENYPFSGGTGAGCTVTPVGFLVVNSGMVNYINTSQDNSITKIFDIATKFYNAIKKEK